MPNKEQDKSKRDPGDLPLFGLIMPSPPGEIEGMAPMSGMKNRDVGSRYRAYRMLARLTLEQVAEQASFSSNMNGEKLTASDVQQLEEQPGKCRIAVHVAVAEALKKMIPDFQEGPSANLGEDLEP